MSGDGGGGEAPVAGDGENGDEGADREAASDPDPDLDAGTDIDPDSDTAAGSGPPFDPDPERVRLLRGVADELRGDSSESRQLSAIVYRISDLYDEDGDTSPEEIYRNVRHIMEIKARGGLRREE